MRGGTSTPGADVASEGELTANERRFVEEYLVDRNQVQAYRRAFGTDCTYATACKNASQLVRKGNVKREIKAAEADFRRKKRIDAGKVLGELAGIAFLDPLDAHEHDVNGMVRLRSLREMPVSVRRAIASVKVKRIPTRPGQEPEEVVEVKFWDKVAALEKLCKHLGILNEPEPLEQLLGKFTPEQRTALVKALASLAGDAGGPPKAPPA